MGSTGKQFVVKLPDWVHDVFSRIYRCYLNLVLLASFNSQPCYSWLALLLFFGEGIYLLFTVLGLRCCAGFSLVAVSMGYPSLLFTRVACLVVEHRLCDMRASEAVVSGLSGCGS